MPLQSGTKLGPYEILAPIGAGGMGEVYKAADARLNRMVAIKVMPSQFCANHEMKQRFEREAQTIAALNHPHICVLYDIGHQDGMDFLVMEYLEGETLAERVRRSALPLDEALSVAIAIADALDKAHGQGVTHRDLKPSNVMLTKNGTKLLDFGLAKLNQQAASRTGDAALPSDTNLTAHGTILGTMQYMAPEQLEGVEADARTDIFAFGAVVYEMVTGKRAFEGKSQATLISAIVSGQPAPLSKLQPMAPPALEYLVNRCLAKDPEQRVQTMWDVMGQLRWIAEGGDQTGKTVPFAAHRNRRHAMAWVALAVVTLLAVTLAIPAFLYLRGSTNPDAVRFLVPVPDMPAPEAISVSPDGRWIAYSARDASTASLFLRPIDVEVPQKLAGTDGAGRMFWSPDSRSIAFFAGGRLKKVDVEGGPPQNICETADLQGGTWNSDGVILFASSKGLQRVLAVGGQPVAVATASGDAGSQKQSLPQEPVFLPDGQHYLYVSGSAQSADAGIYVGSLDSKTTTRLVGAQSNAVYAEGYLLYHREGTLFAQPFNAKKLALSGEAIRVADRIPYTANGAAAFAASQTGVLAYRANPDTQSGQRGGAPASTIPTEPLLWTDRSGGKFDQLAAPGGYAGLNVSPDGKRIAVHRHDADGGDIWIFEVGRGTMTQFTFDASQDNSMPVWSPDGKQIAFGSFRKGKWGLYVKLADNTRNEELLFESETPKMPMNWSPDGKFLVFWTNDPKTSGDVWSLPMTGEKKPVPILQTAADERNPQISPNGKWIAFSSNFTGRSEVYIKPFPDGPGQWRVSLNGGVFPRWRRDSKELYFMSLVSLGNMMAAEISVAGASVDPGAPRPLFQSGYQNSVHAVGQYDAYAVSADGQRFLIPRPERVNTGARGGTVNAAAALLAAIADRHAASAPTSTSMAPITVVLNWTGTLKQN